MLPLHESLRLPPDWGREHKVSHESAESLPPYSSFSYARKVNGSSQSHAVFVLCLMLSLCLRSRPCVQLKEPQTQLTAALYVGTEVFCPLLNKLVFYYSP